MQSSTKIKRLERGNIRLCGAKKSTILLPQLSTSWEFFCWVKRLGVVPTCRDKAASNVVEELIARKIGVSKIIGV